MKYQTTDLILSAAFGWLSGMRSMAGPSIVGHRLSRNQHVRNALAVGAIGEMMVDKHPRIPNRNAPQPLAARTLAGAATGAAIMVSGSGWKRGLPIRSRRYSHHLGETEMLQAAAVGALIGGTTAFIATHVSYHMRRLVSERTKAPNVVLGAAEDALVYGVGIMMSDAL